MVGEPTLDAFSTGDGLLMLSKGAEGGGSVDTIFAPRKRQRQALYPSIPGGTRPETVVEMGNNPFLRLLVVVEVGIALLKHLSSASKKRTRPFGSCLHSMFLYQLCLYKNVVSSICDDARLHKSTG